ncbi:MAG: hypothetical protein M3515_01825 [Actinomycetota bacterium]|nr:hypothetical protein [Actinomycetota bacterium]MDQ3318988.1 hypothetical protein [Actinomycetota bacterium]
MSAYRRSLRRVVAGAAIPYGYTVLVWTSGGVLIETHGPPSAASAFLFLGGAVLAFAAVSLLGGAGPENAEDSADPDGRWTGLSSGIAAAVGLGAAVIVAYVFESSLAFPLAALLATALYLVVSGAGMVLADRVDPRLR